MIPKLAAITAILVMFGGCSRGPTYECESGVSAYVYFLEQTNPQLRDAFPFNPLTAALVEDTGPDLGADSVRYLAMAYELDDQASVSPEFGLWAISGFNPTLGRVWTLNFTVSIWTGPRNDGLARQSGRFHADDPAAEAASSAS